MAWCVLSRFPRFSRMGEHRVSWELPEVEEAAFHGLAGGWAEAVAPHTEASKMNVLTSTLVACGNAIGRSPYIDVGATRHHVNENLLHLGHTSVGRKGEGERAGMRPIQRADEAWQGRIMRGFGSGEALVDAVRDPRIETDKEGKEVVLDAGSDDRRALIWEDEFGHVLAVVSREGSTLSPLLRSAWDGTRLENRTKGQTLTATNAHVSVIAGITPEELLRRVPELAIGDGFLNRFLLVAVERWQMLPRPEPIDRQLEHEYAKAFANALTFARKNGTMDFDAEAGERWDKAYGEELSIRRDGLVGAVCSRAEAHTLRLSMLYALLDQSKLIGIKHLEAALGLWRYSEASARLVFGDRLGDPVADKMLEAIRTARNGCTRDEIYHLFSGHRSRAEIEHAVGRLVSTGRITVETEKTGGRPVTRYRTAPPSENRKASSSPSKVRETRREPDHAQREAEPDRPKRTTAPSPGDPTPNADPDGEDRRSRDRDESIAHLESLLGSRGREFDAALENAYAAGIVDYDTAATLFARHAHARREQAW
jgi:Protein of unknown function (DUF3987)